MNHQQHSSFSAADSDENQQEHQKVQFRKPAPRFIDVNSLPATPAQEPSASAAAQSQAPVITAGEPIASDETDEQLREAQQIEKEQRKMYFYYPKYLHPEAVALLAQSLLDDWENKAQQRLAQHNASVAQQQKQEEQ